MKKSTIEQRIWFSPKASPELKSLQPVFIKLKSVHLDYITAAKDNLYGYNERPHVGLLAAAVWLCGGKALEEFGTSKRNCKNKQGRCDLWIRYNKAEFECEAKRFWLNLKKKTEGLRRKLDKKLTSTVKEVKRLENGKGLALCFAIPGIQSESKQCDSLEGLIGKLIESVKNPVKKNYLCDALIWIGFKANNKPMGESHLLPGLLLAIQEVT